MKHRSFKDLDGDEIVKAIAEMCKKLGICGSVNGYYDLYSIIQDEHERIGGKW